MTFKACVRFRSQDGGGRRKYFIQVKNLETLCSNDRRAISMARTTQQKNCHETSLCLRWRSQKLAQFDSENYYLITPQSTSLTGFSCRHNVTDTHVKAFSPSFAYLLPRSVRR